MTYRFFKISVTNVLSKPTLEYLCIQQPNVSTSPARRAPDLDVRAPEKNDLLLFGTSFFLAL